jgi:hypothetical protein
MNAKSRDTKPHATAVRDRTGATRELDDTRPDRRDAKGRVGAAQLAAPSTRRWRRAGRFKRS